MSEASKTLEKIDRQHKVDARFSDSVQQHRDRRVRAVVGYLEGTYKPLGEWTGRKYRCFILNDPGMTIVNFRIGNPHPAPSGKWMGQPEKRWRIPPAKYRKLTIEERATLECKEQIGRYVSKQWLDNYVSFYYPKEYETRYWEAVTKRKGAFRRPSLNELFPEGIEILERVLGRQVAPPPARHERR
jgi:hypothetical protein